MGNERVPRRGAGPGGALEGARALDLGRRSKPDLLLVSLSTTDAVGHRYGPDSREIHDQLLRLDRWLGWFLDSLATRVPSARTLVVLTSDHGVQSFPERVPGKGRVWWGDLVAKGESEEFGSGLLSADTAATLWRNTIPQGHGWLIAGVLEPGFVWSTQDAGQAQHGSTATLDVTVPIAFVGPGIERAIIHRPVRTVDIAPTLAALLGVRPDGPLDGVPLPEIAGGR